LRYLLFVAIVLQQHKPPDLWPGDFFEKVMAVAGSNGSEGLRSMLDIIVFSCFLTRLGGRVSIYFKCSTSYISARNNAGGGNPLILIPSLIPARLFWHQTTSIRGLN
jgi:hypothetical protein